MPARGLNVQPEAHIIAVLEANPDLGVLQVTQDSTWRCWPCWSRRGLWDGSLYLDVPGRIRGDAEEAVGVVELAIIGGAGRLAIRDEAAQRAAARAWASRACR